MTRVFVPVEEGKGCGDEAKALGMPELAVVGRRQDLEPDAQRELEGQHPGDQQSVEHGDGRDPHRGQPEVLFGVPERRFDPPAPPIPGYHLGRRLVRRRQEVPLRRYGLEAAFEHAALPAMGDAPGVWQPNQVAPVMLRAPLQNRTPRETAVANQHRRQAGAPEVGAQGVNLVEEGQVEGSDAQLHRPMFIGVPQQRDAASPAQEDGLKNPKLRQAVVSTTT